MACLPSDKFPYTTTCESLRKVGEQCESDAECQTTSKCWYQNRQDFYDGRKKKCMMKYNLPNNATFGWSPVFYDTL
jgi:hypothetical protein